MSLLSDATPQRPFLGDLLWQDCITAAVAGVLTIALGEWLSALYALPHLLLIAIGIANLLYGSYSWRLARGARRPLHLIKLLVFANVGWAVCCVVLAAVFQGQASAFGTAHLLIEAGFVGWLAMAEWKRRFQLAGLGWQRLGRGPTGQVGP